MRGSRPIMNLKDKSIQQNDDNHTMSRFQSADMQERSVCNKAAEVVVHDTYLSRPDCGSVPRGFTCQMATNETHWEAKQESLLIEHKRRKEASKDIAGANYIVISSNVKYI